jgi:divalent metal cation (Fe/Co/Zn/Cd) transporter
MALGQSWIDIGPVHLFSVAILRFVNSAADRGPNGIRLGRRHEWSVYVVLALVFGSGAAWAWLHHFARRVGEFGESAHPAELWMQKVHGASAMLALIVLGSLLVFHIPRAWGARRNRPTGSSLVALVAFLVGSGYALYYSGSEPLRAWMSWSHLWVGIALPFFIALHVWRGKRATSPKSIDKSVPGMAARKNFR